MMMIFILYAQLGPQCAQQICPEVRVRFANMVVTSLVNGGRERNECLCLAGEKSLSEEHNVSNLRQMQRKRGRVRVCRLCG